LIKKNIAYHFDLWIILKTAVQDDKVMQSFELYSFSMGIAFTFWECSIPIENEYSSKDCVNLSSSTAVSRIMDFL